MMNIGPQQRRMRMRFGLVLLAVSLGVEVALVLWGVNRWWRVGMFLPFAAAAIGYFQAREKT
jgi:uncharacterized membrane protein